MAIDPLQELKRRRSAALTTVSDPLDELKRRRSLLSNTALSPLMEDEPFAVERPSLPEGPRRSQTLPTMTTTAPAPKEFEQRLARAVRTGTKKAAPFGTEEELTPAQRQQLERARYGRAVAEDIGKAVVGQPERSVRRLATGVANLRNDPRAGALAESLRKIEEETAPETGIGAAARFVSEVGAFAPSGLAMGAVRSGLESAAGEEFSTSSMLSKLTGREGIADARLRAVADAGIDLTIPGLISAVRAARSVKDALKVGDDLAKAFERGAREGAAEGAESVVGSFARKDGYRPRTTPETDPARLLAPTSSQALPRTAPVGALPLTGEPALAGPAIPTRGVPEPITDPSRLIPATTSRTIPRGAEVAPVTAPSPLGPAIPSPAGTVRPEGPASPIVRLLAPQSEALRQRLFWMPAVQEAVQQAEQAAPASRRRTAAEAMARRKPFEQALPEGATAEEVAAYQARRTPLGTAILRAEEAVSGRVLKEEAFGTPAQRRERLARAGQLRRSETGRGPTAAMLPDDVLEQAAREVEGEVPRVRGADTPAEAMDRPIDILMREAEDADELRIEREALGRPAELTAEEIANASRLLADEGIAKATAATRKKMTDRQIALEIAAREQTLAELSAPVDQFLESPLLEALSTASGRAQTAGTRSRVTGNMLTTSAELRQRYRGLTQDQISVLEEAGFDDVDSYFAFKKDIDAKRFAAAAQERALHAARVEQAKRAGVEPPAPQFKYAQVAKPKAAPVVEAATEAPVVPEPKTIKVYHATDADFDVPNAGTMFTTNARYAEDFADQIRSSGRPGRVREAEITLRNPADLRALNMSPSDLTPADIERLKQMGYDSAHYRNEAYIIFDPQQARMDAPVAAAPAVEVAEPKLKLVKKGGPLQPPEYELDYPGLAGWRFYRTADGGMGAGSGGWFMSPPKGMFGAGVVDVPLSFRDKKEAVKRAIKVSESISETGGITKDGRFYKALGLGEQATPRERKGFTSPNVTGALGGFGAGFTAGLATDDPNDNLTPLQRALLYGAGGAAAGAGAMAGVSRIRKTPTVAPSIPELAPVAETINVGRRTPAPEAPGVFAQPARSYATQPSKIVQRAHLLADKAIEGSRRLYNNVVSETFVLTKTAEKFGGKSAAEQIKGAIARQQGAQQSAKQYLFTTLSPVLQGLSDAEQTSLRSLLKARRDLQIRQRGGAAKSAVSADALEAAVAAGNADAKVASAADAITKAHRDLLEMRHEAGLLTDEAYDAILKSDDFYTPLYREIADDKSIAMTLPGSRTGKFGVGSTGVRRMDRTAEALENTADPLEMLAADALRTYRDVGKQRVANVIFNIADRDPAGGALPFVKRIQADPSNPPRRDGIIQQVRNGKLYTYEVTDRDLFEALAGQDKASSSRLLQIAQTMKNLKTSGIVVLPDFAAANVIRDVAMSGLQRPDLARAARESLFGAAVGGIAGAAGTEGDESAVKRFLAGAGLGAGVALYARPFLETMGAVKSIVLPEGASAFGRQIISPDKKNSFADFLANGASTEGFYIKNANDAAEAIKQLQKGPGFSLDDIIIPKNWWETLRKIGSVGEQATRLAAYRQILEAGGTVDDAVRSAQDRTLRFANIGASRTIKNVASMTPFWNAKVQGWDKLARMMNPRKNPQTYALGAAMLAGPSIALWSINKDNPEYWERPIYERNLFWLVPKKAVHGDETPGFYRIPKPFELGFMFASLPERALDYAVQNGWDIQNAAPQMARPEEALERSVYDIGAATFEGTIPLPEIGMLPAQIWANRDAFRNRPIVTRPNLPAELQVTRESSAVARALSKIGISPEQTDFAIRGAFGTAGAEASKAIDVVARRAGVDAPLPPEGTSRIPLVGRFAERFSTSNRGQSEPEALARDQIRELSKIEAGFREMKRLGNPEAILDYAKRNRDALLLAENIQPLERELDKLASLRTKITKDPALTTTQKQQALELLRARGSQLSRQMLTIPSQKEAQR